MAAVLSEGPPPVENGEPLMRHPKKLIICCDGTWMNSDSGAKQTPSNVTRIGHAIVPENKAGHPQIVYYQAGVGTGMGITEQMLGGGTGAGLSENIREAYSFLAHNYTKDDEIFLIGFSRGAFTARSIAGLIGGFGLLEKKALPYFYDIFRDWERAGSKEHKTCELTNAILDFKINVPITKAEEYVDAYRAELVNRKLSQEVDITAIGVWDTVGALGIPTTPLLRKLGFPDFLKEYKFMDTSIDKHIKHAFHALALDEQRSPYAPTLWNNPPGSDTILKQVWFPGAHSNVGGSYDDTAMADITLAWMMDQFSTWIEFDENYIPDQQRLNDEFDAAQAAAGKKAKRGWGLGLIVQSCTFPQSLAGKVSRTPMLYHGEDVLGTKTAEPYQNTCESVHPSVRVRLDRNGLGYDDQGKYAPDGLKEWQFHDEHKHHDTVKTGDHIRSNSETNGEVATEPIRWVYNGKNKHALGKIMYEEKLGKFELQLLKADPEAYKEFSEN